MDWSALRERLLTPQQALAWATAAADAVDARLRTLPASLLQEISEKDGPRRVRRHLTATSISTRFSARSAAPEPTAPAR